MANSARLEVASSKNGELLSRGYEVLGSARKGEKGMKRGLIAVFLVLAACGGSETEADPAPAPSPTADAQTPTTTAPLALDEIATTDEGDVTLDVFNFSDTPQARYVNAVLDEAGDKSPLGLTDKNLILYGLAECDSVDGDGDPPLPTEWEPAPAETKFASELNFLTFTTVARTKALEVLC